MLSKELEKSLNEIAQSASARRHEFITVEHLLLALMNNDAALEVLRNVGADAAKLTSELEKYIEETTPVLPVSDEEHGPQTTLGFQRVVSRSLFHVQSSGRKEVTGANVLVAIFSEQESQAVYLLKVQGVTRIDVVNYISHGISKAEDEEASEAGQQSADGEEPAEAGQKALQLYATDLNEEARAGRIDPLVGRSEELERVIQILCRRRKNNPLLVGESGVGKTAIAEGLANVVLPVPGGPHSNIEWICCRAAKPPSGLSLANRCVWPTYSLNVTGLSRSANGRGSKPPSLVAPNRSATNHIRALRHRQFKQLRWQFGHHLNVEKADLSLLALPVQDHQRLENTVSKANFQQLKKR